MFTDLINNKKYSKSLLRLIATVQLKEHGVECHFDNAAEAINLRASRSEVLEALDKDVTKSADTLFNALPIINSIKNNRVVEFDSIYNTVEDVFGLSFDKLENKITLCGVVFEVGAKASMTKAEIKAEILKAIFDIDRAELSGVLKTLTKYESTQDEYEKAILYPSTILADKIITKVVEQDIAFASVRKGMSHEERAAFDTTFSRTGIDGVIQNSTYISAKGIEQISPSHKVSEAKELGFLLTAGRTKYIEAVEIDGDGDVIKMEKLVKQIERLKINASFKFTLKARKLGNYSARGLFMQSQLIVAEDVRDTTAALHELGHLVHLVDFSVDNFVNYLIAKLTPLVNVPNELVGKTAYYMEPTEVVARACEIAGLFAKEAGNEVLNDDDGFALIKQKSFYEKLSGIYFDFQNFDETTKQELLALFELFFNTKYGSARPSGIDNFIKINTRYTRVEKEKSYRDVLNEERARAEKELRALYSLVNANTIANIFENKKTASAEVLAIKILANISYCGNHQKSMTTEAWAEVIEDKAIVVNFIVDFIQKHVSKKEWILFILAIRKNSVWDRVRNSVLLGGFNTKAAASIRKALKEKTALGFEQLADFRTTTMTASPAIMIDAEMAKDEEFILKVLDESSSAITSINADFIDIETLVKWNRYVINKVDDKKFGEYLIHPALGNHFEFMDECIEKDYMCIVKALDDYRNDAQRMDKLFEQHGFTHLLRFLGAKLKDDVEYAKSLAQKSESNQFLDFFTDRVKAELAKTGDVDLFEVEVERIQSGSTNIRRKAARNTEDPRILHILAKDRNNDVRAEVARNQHVVAGTLIDLAKLKSTYVRAAVAGNKNTPKPILDNLMKEKGEGSIDVIEALARNPKLTLKDLLKISKEKKEYRYVKWSVLCNPVIMNFNHNGDIKTLREIVRNCIEGEEEDFHYQMRTADAFRPSLELLKDMGENIGQYIITSGYEEAFKKLSIELMGGAKPAEQAIKVIVKEPVVKQEEATDEDEDFDSLIEQGEIVEFERTDGKGVEQVLRIKTEIEDFKGFNNWLKLNKKGYYSKFAKGFILYPEFASELSKKLGKGTQAAASVAASIYSADMLQAFASGTLF